MKDLKEKHITAIRSGIDIHQCAEKCAKISINYAIVKLEEAREKVKPICNYNFYSSINIDMLFDEMIKELKP